MNKIVYYVVSSIDGFICRENENISGFVEEGNGVQKYLEDLKTFETVIMGKKTVSFNLLAILFFLLVGCNPPNKENEIEKWKTEIVEVEKAFNDMAQKEGLIKAFEFYAAEEGVIRRKNKIVKGKAAIAKWYTNDVRPNETLTWKPTFVDVSQSGDLAYTYGDFTFTYPDTLGNKKQNTGIFHTVWKRQADGKWRFVWD